MGRVGSGLIHRQRAIVDVYATGRITQGRGRQRLRGASITAGLNFERHLAIGDLVRVRHIGCNEIASRIN